MISITSTCYSVEADPKKTTMVEVSLEDAELLRRLDTFRRPISRSTMPYPVNDGRWKSYGRPDYQTPLAFAEAGFVCTGPDSVRCDQCRVTFTDWKPADVPMTEHQKINTCAFLSKRYIDEMKSHPSFMYAMDTGMLEFHEMMQAVKEHPHLLDEPFEKFYSFIIKRRVTKEINPVKKPAQDPEEERKWADLLKKYHLP